MNREKYMNYVVDVPNFPVKGIIFKDITPVLENPEAYEAAIEDMAEIISDLEFDKILTCDSRGFLLGSPLALKFKKPLVLARKPGKLPRPGKSASYAMEYGTNNLQISEGSINEGDRILIVDDILATGGTSLACDTIVKSCGAKTIGLCHLIELDPLKAKDKFNCDEVKIRSCIHYDVY